MRLKNRNMLRRVSAGFFVALLLHMPVIAYATDDANDETVAPETPTVETPAPEAPNETPEPTPESPAESEITKTPDAQDALKIQADPQPADRNAMLRATAFPSCQPGRFYALNGAGAVTEFDSTNGTSTTVGSWSVGSGADALGIGPDGAVMYAVHKPGIGSYKVLRYTKATGAWESIPGSDIPAGTPDVIMGGVNPVTGTYFYAGYRTSGIQRDLRIYEYNPVLNTHGFVGFISTGIGLLTTARGDLAFDAAGNLLVLVSTDGLANATNWLYSITAETIAQASGGVLPYSQTATKYGAPNGVRGLAFDSDGSAVLGITPLIGS